MSTLQKGKKIIAVMAVISSFIITSCSGALSGYSDSRSGLFSTQIDGYAVLYNTPSDPTNKQYTDIRVGGKNVKYYMYEIDGIKWSKTYPIADRICEGEKTGTGAFTGKYVDEALTEGLHIIKVCGFKSLEDLTSAQPREKATTFIWRVDTTLPIKDDIILTGQPDNITGDTSATITVSGFDIAGYKYKFENLTTGAPAQPDYGPAFRSVSKKITIRGMTGDPVTEYRLSVIAIDSAGNEMTIADPKIAIWRVDLTQPIAKFINKPDKYTSSTDINITVGGSNSRFTVFEYSYKLDGGEWSDFVSTSQSITATGLAKGEHIIQARARGYDKQNGNAVVDQSSGTPTIYTWTILVAAEMSITVTRFPSEDPTMATYARFTVTGGSGSYVRYYRYRLDNGTWSANRDIWKETYITDLELGSHTFDVIGIDLGGNEKSAVPVEWTIIPYNSNEAVLGNLPADPTNITTTDIDVLGNAADSTIITGYQYILDNGMLSEEQDSAVNIVEPGKTIFAPSLAEGDHLVRVFAENVYGAWQPFSSPTQFSWEIDLTYPVAVLDPATLPVGAVFPPLTEPTATEDLNNISIRVGGAQVVNYRYRLDGGTWSDAASITELLVETGLATAEDPGFLHTLEVIGQDAAGNWQGCEPDGDHLADFNILVTKITWRVNAELPTARLVNILPVDENTSETTVIAGVDAVDPYNGIAIDMYQYRLDEGAWSGNIDIATAIDEEGLADGRHTLYAVAHDANSNWQTYAGAETDAYSHYSWIVDTTDPTVNAGADVLARTTASLNATADDDPGTAIEFSGIATYAWSKVTGPGTLTFGSAGAEDTTVSASVDGTYMIRLTVTDYAGNSAFDEMQLIWDTTPPTVNAGTDKTANITVIQNATVTDAGDGGIASYLWEDITAAPAGTINFGTAAAEDTTIAATDNDTYTIRLTVTDNAGNSASDTMTLTWDTSLPTVDAGTDKTTNTLVSQDAYVSASGPITSYLWEKVSGPGTITFSNESGSGTGVDTDISANTDGTYLLRLTVTESGINTASSTMTLIWDTAPPAVNAGSDKIVNASASQDATISDTYGIASYAWTKQSGTGTITFGNASGTTGNADTSISSDTNGIFTLRLTVTDNAGNSAYDEMQFTWDTAAPTVNAGSDIFTNAAYSIDAVTTENGPSGIASRTWTQYSGTGTITFGTPGAEDTTVSANTQGVYVLRLTVVDNAGNSAYDDVQFTWDTTAPTVNAGTDKSVNAAVSQDATISDTYGIASYAWTKDSGTGTLTFSNATGTTSNADTTISASVDGSYVVRLTVTDAAGNSNSDTMTLVWDITAPRISSITSSSSSGTYIIGNTVNVTVTLDEAAQLSTGGNLSVTLETGAADAVVNVTATGYATVYTGTYTVAEGHVSADLDSTGVSITGTLTDAVGNSANLTLPATTIADGSNIVVDGVRPILMSAQTIDLNRNGHIDHYKLTFDQPVKDTSFPGYVANGAGSAQSVWAVQGYTGAVLSHGTYESGLGDIANDAVIYLKFTEDTDYDTGAKPVIAMNDAPVLTDANGNTVSFTNFVAGSGGVHLYNYGLDGASPIITAASGVTGTDTMTVSFSEDSIDANGTGSCGDSNPANGDLVYTNGDGAGAGAFSSMTDNNACDGTVGLQLNADLERTDIGVDEVNAAADSFYDMSGNEVDITPIYVSGAISPYVLNAYATSTTTFRVVFSEPVNEAQATTISSYTFGEEVGGDPTSSCTNISSITAITRVDTNGAVYQFTNGGIQCTNVTYEIDVNDPSLITDKNDGVALRDGSTTATFLGNEDLRVVAGSCSASNLSQMTVVFNKPVQTTNAQNIAQYKFRGPYYDNLSKPLGTIWGATRSSDGLENEVTIKHNQEGQTYYQQRKVGYTVIVSEGYTGTGRVYEDASLTGSSTVLQADPKDRITWNGCGATVTDFSSGPISVDPFGDSSTFGYVVKFKDWVFIGPNEDGNTITGMEPDGTNPLNHTFVFEQDTNDGGGEVGGFHSNIPSMAPYQPYVNIGHTGCTPNSVNVSAGCGPDNENGRGLFVSGTVGSTEYLFITAARSAGDNDYIYRTTDTDQVLNFEYMDTAAIYDSQSVQGNSGTESIHVFGNKLYVMQPGNLRYRPYMIRIDTVTGSDLANGTDGAWLNARSQTGIGVYGANRNFADKIGGTLFGFGAELYLANSGSVTDNPGTCNASSTPSSLGGVNCQQTGGIIRYNAGTSTWTDITPTANTDFSYRLSIVLPKLYDLIPAERPYPAFTEFNGNLYMIRNACTRTMINRNCDCSDLFGDQTTACSDDKTCTGAGGTPVPQLWKCTPGANNLCDANEWSLVAENGTNSITNMGDTDNTHITMLVANGDYLYIGFDNATDGVKIYRTGSTNPTAESDFDSDTGTAGIQTFAPAGLSDPSRIKQIYSALSIPDGGDNYIYISAGYTNLVNGDPVPVAVYRQKNE